MNIAADRIANLTLWVLQIFFAILFLYSGVDKCRPNAVFWIEMFGKIVRQNPNWTWFRYFTGSLEIVSAILLLIPKTSALAAALLAFTMAGAVLAHLLILRDGYASLFPAFPLLLLILIAWKRRPNRSRATKMAPVHRID